MSDRTFELPNSRGALHFTTEVLKHMYTHAQTRWCHKEAGGQLFSSAPEMKEVVIGVVTGPHRVDRRGRHSFHPDNKAADQDREQLFSEGYHAVGLWHTHPEATPHPSKTDRDTAFNYLEAFNGDLEGFLLVTLGNKGSPLNMSVCLASVIPKKQWIELHEL